MERLHRMIDIVRGWFGSPLQVNWIPEPDTRTEAEKAIDEILLELERL